MRIQTQNQSASAAYYLLTFDNTLEGEVDIRRVQSACFNQGHLLALSVVSCVFRLDLAHLSQIRLVPDQHQRHVLLTVRAQLGQPALDILKRLLLRDVVDEQRARRAPIVRRRDGSIAVLPCRVPNLRLNDVARLCGDCARRELHADRGTRLQIELVLGEAREQVGLAHARVAHKHDLVHQVVTFLLLPARRCSLPSG